MTYEKERKFKKVPGVRPHTAKGGYFVNEKPLPPLRSHFNTVEVYLIEGMSTNPMGHVLIKIPVEKGQIYVHAFNGIHGPKWFDARAMDEFLARHHRSRDPYKTIKIKLPNPKGFERELNESMNEPFVWVPVFNDCSTYVRHLLQAGGTDLEYKWFWDRERHLPKL